MVRPCSKNGRRKSARGRPKKNWMEGIKKAMNERNLNEGQWEDRKQRSLGVGQRRKTFWTRYIHTYKDPLPIGCVPRPVWTGAENLAPAGIRSTDRPASSESLYRLHYPSPRYLINGTIFEKKKKNFNIKYVSDFLYNFHLKYFLL